MPPNVMDDKRRGVSFSDQLDHSPELPSSSSRETSSPSQPCNSPTGRVSSDTRDLLEYARAVLNWSGVRVTAALIVTTIGVNVLAMLLYLVVAPWSHSLYRRMLSQYCAKFWIDAMVFVYPRVTVHITGDSDMLGSIGPSIVVCNHQVSADWMHVLLVARCVGLHGNVKMLIRRQLGQIPLLGWALWWLDFPSLGSNWQDDRVRLTSLLSKFSQEKLPVTLLIFPEGGHTDKPSVANSRKFAEREGRPKLSQLLLPHTKGFYASLDALKNAGPVVYDMTICDEEYRGDIPPEAPSSMRMLIDWLFGQVPRAVHVRMKRFSMEEVTGEPQWLDHRWALKDKQMLHFKHHHQFPSDGRGFAQHHTFDSTEYRREASALALVTLCGIVVALPMICALLIVPMFWLTPVAFAVRGLRLLGRRSSSDGDGGLGGKSADATSDEHDAATLFRLNRPLSSPRRGPDDSTVFSDPDAPGRAANGGRERVRTRRRKPPTAGSPEPITPGLPPTPFVSPQMGLGGTLRQIFKMNS